ncbi:MAG: RNA 2',3'-cyclic phosphodiesterase [Gemmobacter sp.]|jgi:2'-5' RNA ligase|nr:RNA 2',3'-cyclic phosphodiesterase [Gemmobacter sp.]
MIRVFVALAPPEDLRRRLVVLQHSLPLQRRQEPEDLHLTLAFLGAQPDSVLEMVHDGLKALRAEPFTLMLSGVGIFGGAKPRVVWAGIEASEALHRMQARVAVQAGVTPPKGFTPHITLGRCGAMDEAARLRLEAAAAGQGFRTGPWIVSEIGFYASYLGTRGQRYELLASYPLS